MKRFLIRILGMHGKAHVVAERKNLDNLKVMGV